MSGALIIINSDRNQVLKTNRYFSGRQLNKNTFYQQNIAENQRISILCSVSAGKSYGAISAKTIKLSAEFITPTNFEINQEP
jgi:hypothetical protein